MVGEQPRIFATERLLTPFIQVVDDLGAAIVEHQLRGSAFRSTDGKFPLLCGARAPLSSWPR